MSLILASFKSDPAFQRAAGNISTGARVLMAEQGIPSVSALARKAGVEIHTAQLWFRGSWTLGGLVKIASTLGVEPWELLKAGEPRERTPAQVEAGHRTTTTAKENP